YIDSKGYDKAKVAVEINMDILPRCDYDLRELKNGDTVEIVSFVGGG
ncbi:MAG: sulfur carrier protein ThiS, partial [Butyrivibrio sp.]|nr:sulfur carrier protein ThiS [Butyrivibrio sp.]